jgi:hypothetical protein
LATDFALIHGTAHDRFWGKKDEARKWDEKAVQWMDKNQRKDEELCRFRSEAEELLGLKK